MVNNTVTEGNKYMSQIFRSNAKTNTSDSQASKIEQPYWASDDVHRIAKRTPALFRTNPVPQISSRPIAFDDAQSGVL